MAALIYVDPVFGNNANAGTTPALAKATIEAAVAAVDAGGTVKLLTGEYIDQAVSTLKSVTIAGEGVVRIRASTLTTWYGVTQTGVSISVRLKNLRLEDWTIFYDVVPNTSPTNHDAFVENCTFSRATAGGEVFRLNVSPGLTSATMRVRLQNNTTRNVSVLLHLNSSNFNSLTTLWEHNNFYDALSSLTSHTDAGGGLVGSVQRGGANFNAFDGNTTEVNGFNSTGVVRSTIYTDLTSAPPNLSLKRGVSPSPLIGIGEFGDDIGAPFWPVFQNRTQEGGNNFFPTDWTGWANDERYFDTVLNAPGVDGPAGASPTVLTAAEPRGWIIDPTRGLGASARVLGPVQNAGVAVDFESTTWWGEENATLAPGSKEVIDNSSGTALREIEFRAANAAFSATAVVTGEVEWALIAKTGRPVVKKQYWQFRVVVRSDGQ